eukprot:2347100-Prymnesium_polylepis.1
MARIKAKTQWARCASACRSTSCSTTTRVRRRPGRGWWMPSSTRATKTSQRSRTLWCRCC